MVREMSLRTSWGLLGCLVVVMVDTGCCCCCFGNVFGLA